jgi:molybdopterin-guanine dinucleotide biosynthesis protein A
VVKDASQVTGLVLAGGKGTRMGGVDKGLQALKGRPLIAWVLEALAPQVQSIFINANRNQEAYVRFGVPILTDSPRSPSESDVVYDGPLAGMLAGLRACPTPWLVTTPCDVPVIPADYVHRLLLAAQMENRTVAMARATELDPLHPSKSAALRRQPVFCLIHRDLADDLAAYLARGERKIDRWTDTHQAAMVDFELYNAPALAFANINTLQELGALESLL